MSDPESVEDLTSPHPDIRCLLQSAAANPRLSLGTPPPGLLAPEERARFDDFTAPKRRQDWLLGRWTAKHLVRSYLAESGPPPQLDMILILTREDGSPYASLAGSAPTRRLPISLSISHSAGQSFCALTDRAGATVGADLETIEPRPLSLPEQFFTPGEFAAVRASAPTERDLLITLIWSAKEAFLKATRAGLRADTRSVQCQVRPGVHGTESWQRLETEHRTPLAAGATYSAWWRSGPGCVLTLGLLSQT